MLLAVMVCLTCAARLVGQPFHAGETAQLRAFLRQNAADEGRKNFQQLGIADTNAIDWATVTGLTWGPGGRLTAIIWNDKYLAGDLDLSGFDSLRVLRCQVNNLTSLLLTRDSALVHVDCYDNLLTRMDITTNINLQHFCCRYNRIATLDVTRNPRLTFLCLSGNPFTRFDLSNNPLLTEFYAAKCSLEEIDFSRNPLLKLVSVRSNKLKRLDVSNLANLQQLFCYDNQLTELKVGKNEKLKFLHCENNQLTSLDVSGNPNLKNLDCSSNALKALNVSGNKELQKLECKNDQLTTLDVSGNTKLMYLYCEQNQLTSLDVSKNTRLSTLNCTDNRLTSLDLSQNTELSTLNCTNNRLTSLDLSQNTRLDSLYCGGNRLTFLDLQGLTLTGSATVGGQTRDGLTVSAIGGAYVVDLGAFLSRDRFDKVKDLAGKASDGTPLSANYDLASGKATFNAKPVTVTYRYDTQGHAGFGGLEIEMDVTLIESNTITVSVSGRGRVTRQGSTEALSGNVAVFPGDDETFVILANAGYEIADLRADNAPVSVPSRATRYEYTFRNVTENHTLRAAFRVRSGGSPSNPGGSPSNPDVPPTSPDVPPTSPDVPPVNPPASVDIPASAGQWTVFWGTPDAQGNVEVTVQVPIKSEVPLVEGSIRVDALGIEGIRIKLLPDGAAASARAMAQQYSYLLQITGTVAENALSTARIDALHYRLEGGEEKMVRLGTNGDGILLKDMKKGTEPPKSSSGGGCAAGLGSAALLALLPLCIRRRR